MTDDEDPNEVWSSTVDKGKFMVSVKRTEPYTGELRVTVEETGEELLKEQVGLSYDALFGPDVSDLAEWKDKALEAIDAWILVRQTDE